MSGGHPRPPFGAVGCVPIDGLPRSLERSISGRIESALHQGYQAGHAAGRYAGQQEAARDAVAIIVALLRHLDVAPVDLPLDLLRTVLDEYALVRFDCPGGEPVVRFSTVPARKVGP